MKTWENTLHTDIAKEVEFESLAYNACFLLKGKI